MDLEVFYKAQRERLIRLFGSGSVREYGSRFHAHGHGGRGVERDGTVPWERGAGLNDVWAK